MADAALAMRYVMSREEEPSFVIKDPRYVKESTNTTSLLHIFNVINTSKISNKPGAQ